MSPKFAPRLRARAIWKSKSLKIESFGAFFEFEIAKICTPARENDLEVKIVKIYWEVRTTFCNWSRHACARDRSGSQNFFKFRGSEHFWRLKSPKFAPTFRRLCVLHDSQPRTRAQHDLHEPLCTAPATERPELKMCEVRWGVCVCGGWVVWGMSCVRWAVWDESCEMNSVWNE